MEERNRSLLERYLGDILILVKRRRILAEKGSHRK
jgi:hypothetical protein